MNLPHKVSYEVFKVRYDEGVYADEEKTMMKWCQQHVGEVLEDWMIKSECTPALYQESKLRIDWKFKDPNNALLFKLTWI